MDNPADPAIVPSIVNALDIGVGILLLISAVFAYLRGLVQEVLSIAGWIGAIFATVYGFPYAQPFARPSWARAISPFSTSFLRSVCLAREVCGRVSSPRSCTRLPSS